jgi:tetratricopeptide (TPR) repeat protein
MHWFDWIVVIADEAALKVESDVRATVPRGTILVVRKRHFVGRTPTGWCWVRWKKIDGWIHGKIVLPIEQALTYFTQAIGRKPTAQDYNTRGWIWRLGFKYDKAMADLNAAIALRPEFAEALYRRGAVWACKREDEKAISDYTEAIRLDPRLTEAYRGRGSAWQRLSEHDKALADFTEAIRLDPNGTTYTHRGTVWKAKGEYAEAIADYTEAISLYPNLAFPYDGIARIMATCPDAVHRDGRRAVRHATKACDLSYRRYPFIDTLASAYAEAGDFEQAILCQQEAIKRAPEEDKDACRSRLELYRQRKPYRAPSPAKSD